jgi:hypothetical protein
MPHGSSEPTSGVAADIERIEAMRAAGRITGEEAERLIAVLREIGEVESDLDAIPEPPPPPPAPVPEAAGGTRAGGGPRAGGSDTPRPPEPAPAPAAEAGGAAAEAGATEHAERWTLVKILAGDVRIRAGDVAEPVLAGDDTSNLTLERQGDGWVVRDTAGSWFERGAPGSWFDRHRPTDVDLTLPRGVGVRLDVKAGDVRIQGVEAVAGKMMAGDLWIDGAQAIDVHKSAGDLSAKVRLSHGRHRIRASAGDVEVTLLDGSDVTVAGAVTLGAVHGPSGFAKSSSGMGGSVEGTIGLGTARLEVRLSAGDMRIVKEDRHG